MGKGMETLDLFLINPSDRRANYHDLGADLTVVEPPLWCRLVCCYMHKRGYSLQIEQVSNDTV